MTIRAARSILLANPRPDVSVAEILTIDRVTEKIRQAMPAVVARALRRGAEAVSTRLRPAAFAR